MAVNLSPPKDLANVAGIRLGTAEAAVKRPGRDDVLLIDVAAGATAAGVFTKSSFRAAPVLIAEQHLRAGAPRALLFNSGNANAATGKPGHDDALICCRAVAEQLGIAPEAVLPFSTGVIGVRLPVDRMVAALPKAKAALRADGWDTAARAVMTTDTVPKACSQRFRVGDIACHVSGFAKGAGMIRPDMATMLAFAATDAAVDAELLRQLVRELADESFNRVTIDGDTSTNDSFVVVATGRSGSAPIRSRADAGFAALQGGLRQVCQTLAQAIVRDGEGATRFVTIRVQGGRTQKECADVAFTIAHSPLVKTAMFAGDANWGRYCAAIGRAGIVDLDVTRVDLFLDDVCVARSGLMDAAYTDDAGSAVMAKSEYCVRVVLGRGGAEDTVWTTDLSYDYVKINAEYRT